MSQAQSIHSNQKYEKLKSLLKELFQLDQPDLDFGLYRIMHAKSAEITQFLDNDLLPQVKEAFSLYKDADSAELQIELAKKSSRHSPWVPIPRRFPKLRSCATSWPTKLLTWERWKTKSMTICLASSGAITRKATSSPNESTSPVFTPFPMREKRSSSTGPTATSIILRPMSTLRDYAFCLRPDDKNPMRVRFMLADATEGEHGNAKEGEGKESICSRLRKFHC